MRLLRGWHFDRVARRALRVALYSTAIVAIVYTAIAGIVVFSVSQNLTGQIDQRLTSTLHRIQSDPFRPIIGVGGPGPAYYQSPSNGQFGVPLLVWTVDASGNVNSSDDQAPLPTDAHAVTEPTTVSIGGTDVRVDGVMITGTGTDLDGTQVIIGQSMSDVTQAQGTLLFAELGVAPLLLLAVFLGAVAIGYRVGGPIELARRRQLEFTADASHELRTPLSVIEAHTSLALTQDRDVDWYRDSFSRISHETGRIRRLVEDLLWLARVDATEGQAAFEPTDVEVLAEGAVGRFATVAETRQLVLSLATDGSAVVTAPPEWLDRLIGVLLDNACKYSVEKGEVKVVVATTGNRVRLSVDDSGPGIPPEERPLIFDRFHRASDQPGGAGLGLAIADAVVQHTHGRWEIGSSLQGGASMSVTWPRTLVGGSQQTAPTTIDPQAVTGSAAS